MKRRLKVLPRATKSSTLKRGDMVRKICSIVQIERQNPRARGFSFEELVFIHSWVNIAADMRELIEQKMEEKEQKWK